MRHGSFLVRVPIRSRFSLADKPDQLTLALVAGGGEEPGITAAAAAGAAADVTDLFDLLESARAAVRPASPPPPCTFTSGQMWDSFEQLFRAASEYAERAHFAIRINRSSKKDGVPWKHITCSAYGHRERHKPGVPQRQVQNLGLHCTWSFTTTQCKPSGKWRIVTVCADHAGDCVPSASLRSTMLRARGNQLRLPAAVANSIISMTATRIDIRSVRAMVADVLPHAALDCAQLYNLVACVRRQAAKVMYAAQREGAAPLHGEYAADPVFADHVINTSSLDGILSRKEHQHAERLVRRLLAARLLAGECGGNGLKDALQDLAKADRAFAYRIWVTEDNLPLAFLWMTGRMQRLLLDFGDVLFLDAKMSGCNDEAWPVWLPTVVDGNGRTRRVAHCITSFEADDAVTWMLEMLADIMKHGDTQRMPTETVFTDGKISTACIVTVLPNARHFICAWHIYTMNLEKHLQRVPCRAEISRDFYWKLVKSTTEQGFRAAADAMLAKLAAGSRPRAYLQGLVDKAHLWAGYARCQAVTMGVEGNTRAEQSNSVLQSVTQGHSLSFVPLLTALLGKENSDVLRDEDNMRTEQTLLQTKLREYEAKHGLPVAECLLHQTTYAADLFRTEVTDAEKYRLAEATTAHEGNVNFPHTTLCLIALVSLVSRWCAMGMRSFSSCSLIRVQDICIGMARPTQSTL